MDHRSLFRPFLTFPQPRLYPLYGLLCLVLVCSTEKSLKKEAKFEPPQEYPVGIAPLELEETKKNLTREEMLATMAGVADGCYRNTSAPLDLLFLVDRTSKKVRELMDKVGKVADELREQFEGSRFGLSFFADFSCKDLHPVSKCKEMVKQEEAHEEPEGCYTRQVSLTDNLAHVKISMSTFELLGGQEPKAGLAAVLLAATDENLDWTNTDDPKKEINRVIFLLTDSGTTCCEKKHGTKQKPKGDGSDKCSTMDNPTPEFVRGKLRQREISLFVGLVEGKDEEAAVESWQNMTDKIKVASGLVNFEDDELDKIVEQFKDFLVTATFLLGPVGCLKSKTPTLAQHKSLIPNAPISQKIEVDLFFLVDRTSVLVRSLLPKLMKIVDKVQEEYPGSRFGMGYYADFVCSDWETEEECKQRGTKGQELTDRKACYTFGTKLSVNGNKVKSLSRSVEVLPRRGPESGIAALLLTATDDKIGWTVDPDRNRIIFVITDDGTSCCEKPFGTKKNPKGDGSDKCHTMDNPTPEFTGVRLRDREISVFLALAKGGSAGAFDTFSNWKEMAGRMKVPFEWANIIQDKTSTIYRKLRAWIITIMYKYSYGGSMLQPGTLEMGKVLKGKGEKASVDVLFLIDRGSKTVLKMAPNVVAIVSNIKRDFPGSRFGMSFYSDFICTDWYSKSDCMEKVAAGKEHMESEGCYTFNTSLSLNRKQLLATSKHIEHLPGTGTQAGIAALLLSTVDRKVHWSEASEFNRYKIIFVITDDGSHCCSKDFGTKKPPKGDGTDKCKTMNNPTPEFTGKKMKEEKTSLFLLLANGESETDTFQNWMEMVGRMKVAYGVANLIQDDNPVIYHKFKEFVGFLMTQRGQTLKKKTKEPKGEESDDYDDYDDYDGDYPNYGKMLPCPTQVLMAVPMSCCPSLPGSNCTQPTTRSPAARTMKKPVTRTTTAKPEYDDEIAPQERVRKITTTTTTEEPSEESAEVGPADMLEELSTTTDEPSTTTEEVDQEVEDITEMPSEETEEPTESPGEEEPEETEEPTKPPGEEETTKPPCEDDDTGSCPPRQCCPDAPSICPPIELVAIPLAFPGLPYGCPWYQNTSDYVGAYQEVIAPEIHISMEIVNDAPPRVSGKIKKKSTKR